MFIYVRRWGLFGDFSTGGRLFLVIQTGTIAAVGVGFGKFLGVFFPSVNTQHWLWHIGSCPPVACGAHGPWKHGYRAEYSESGCDCHHCAADDFEGTLGVKMGAAVQNLFTSAKVLALAAVVLVGVLVRDPAAVAANFGAGWHNFWLAGARLEDFMLAQAGSTTGDYVGLHTTLLLCKSGRCSVRMPGIT